jgi:iron complex transport system substrate-binding protein
MDKFAQPFTDAGGETHAPQKPRQRIISLVPSLTETLCALGGRERLVGCTAFCVHPEGLLKDANVIKVGGTKTVLREKLLALKPDLLLMNMEENTLEDIAYFRERVECYLDGTKTLEDGLESILNVGALIGAETTARDFYQRGQATLAKIDAARAERIKQGGGAPRVFYAIWREPWMTINRDTFIHAMLERCGAQNIFAAHAKRYPEVSLQEILDAKPEIVWLPGEPYRFKEKHRAEWSNLPVTARAPIQRVELVDGEFVCWFGVRQIAGMEYTFRQLWKS